ncbi:MAG: tetratricopeptide repeat protein [Candidatus Poribacteria bacterium]|nr:tetratricopeptide repeat protein [Candidatus Poribacteria bacterium]
MITSHIDAANAAYREFRNGNYESAIAFCDTLISYNPQIPNIYRLRADAKMNLAQYEEAIADCNKALELDPCNSASLTRGFAHYFSYQNKEAIQDFTCFIDLNRHVYHARKSLAYAYKTRADVLHDLSRNREAKFDYLRALYIAQNDGDALLIAQITPSLEAINKQKKGADSPPNLPKGWDSCRV